MQPITTTISLCLNAATFLVAMGLFLLVTRGIHRVRSSRALPWRTSLSIAAALTLGLLLALNLNYHQSPAPLRKPFQDSTSIRAMRQKAVEAARNMVGLPMMGDAHPDGVLCCDVAFAPYDAACGIKGKIVADYHVQRDPTQRYPLLYDARRCPIRKNLKFLWDRAWGTPRNTPDNPYFLRRINNLAAYLHSCGRYYRPDLAKLQPGMLVFLQRDRDSAPTHIAVISKVNAKGIWAIQTSGSYDGDGNGEPDYRVVEVPLTYISARTHIVAIGDVIPGS